MILLRAKCVNCGGNHNAAYKKCPKYQTVSNTLNFTAHEKISYRDAVQSLKETEQRGDTVSACTTGKSPTTSADDNIGKPENVKQPTSTVDDASAATTPNRGTTATPVVDMASNSAPSASVQSSDEILNLITTTTSILLWLISNIPPSTAGRDQIVEQLNAVQTALHRLTPTTAPRQ